MNKMRKYVTAALMSACVFTGGWGAAVPQTQTLVYAAQTTEPSVTVSVNSADMDKTGVIHVDMNQSVELTAKTVCDKTMEGTPSYEWYTWDGETQEYKKVGQGERFVYTADRYQIYKDSKGVFVPGKDLVKVKSIVTYKDKNGNSSVLVKESEQKEIQIAARKLKVDDIVEPTFEPIALTEEVSSALKIKEKLEQQLKEVNEACAYGTWTVLSGTLTPGKSSKVTLCFTLKDGMGYVPSIMSESGNPGVNVWGKVDGTPAIHKEVEIYVRKFNIETTSTSIRNFGTNDKTNLAGTTISLDVDKTGIDGNPSSVILEAVPFPAVGVAPNYTNTEVEYTWAVLEGKESIELEVSKDTFTASIKAVHTTKKAKPAKIAVKPSNGNVTEYIYVDVKKELRSSKIPFPALQNKVYDAQKKSAKEYWSENLPSEKYEIIDVRTTAGSYASINACGGLIVCVKYTPEEDNYNLVNDAQIAGVRVDESGTCFVKEYPGMSILKDEITKVKWPEQKSATGKYPLNSTLNDIVDTQKNLTDGAYTYTYNWQLYAFGKWVNVGAAEERLPIGAECANYRLRATIENNTNCEIAESAAYKTYSFMIDRAKLDVQVEFENGTNYQILKSGDKDVVLRAKLTDPIFEIYDFTFTWYKDGVAIPVTSNSYNITTEGKDSKLTVKVAESAEYSCQVSLNTGVTKYNDVSKFDIGNGVVLSNKAIAQISEASFGYPNSEHTASVVYGSKENVSILLLGKSTGTYVKTVRAYYTDDSGKPANVRTEIKEMMTSQTSLNYQIPSTLDAGVYKVYFEVTILQDGKEVVLYAEPITLTVEKRVLSIASAKLEAKELVYGQKASETKFTYVGTDKDIINASVRFEVAKEQMYPAGTVENVKVIGTVLNPNNYVLDGGNGVTENYYVTLTVVPASLAVTVKNLQVKNVDVVKDTLFELQYVQLPENVKLDNVSYMVHDESGKLMNLGSKFPVGTYTVLPVVNLTGSSAGNYKMVAQKGTLSVLEPAIFTAQDMFAFDSDEIEVLLKKMGYSTEMDMKDFQIQFQIKDRSGKDCSNKKTLDAGLYVIHPVVSFANDDVKKKYYIVAKDASLTVEEHAHFYEEVVTPAKLGKSGKIQKTCKLCGHVESQRGVTAWSDKNIYTASSRYVFNGKQKLPKIIVKNAKGTTINAKYYDVQYKNNTNIGTASYTVTFKGAYEGSVTKTFYIVPKTTVGFKLKACKSGFVATWNKVEGITKYQIRYSLDKEFKNVSYVSATTNQIQKTIVGLSRDQIYYAQIRSYKKIGGKMYVSGWSTIRGAKTL